jgi:hypothetical protein
MTRQFAAAVFLLFALSLIVGATGQDQKGKPECESPTKAVPPPAQDSEFALASANDAELAGQAFVTEKVAPTLAVFGAIPTNRCEVENVFQVIEGTEKLHPMEIDLVNIRDVISPLVKVVTALPTYTRTADGFRAFLKRCDAAYVAILGHRWTPLSPQRR